MVMGGTLGNSWRDNTGIILDRGGRYVGRGTSLRVETGLAIERVGR